jgi:hypothetical protein
MDFVPFITDIKGPIAISGTDCIDRHALIKKFKCQSRKILHWYNFHWEYRKQIIHQQVHKVDWNVKGT